MEILQVFLTSLIRVGLLVAMAVPGFVLKKLKKLPENSIAVISALIIYISQPMLSLYSFIEASFSSRLLLNMGIAFVLAIVFNLGTLLLAKVIFLKDKDVEAGKVCTIGSALSNCGFMGIPVIKVLFDDPQITIYAIIYMVVFNIVLWTLGVYVITGDKKYVSVKKAFLNLPTIVLVIALPIFFLNLNLTASANPAIQAIMQFCDYFNNFNAPLPMLIMGIRLADVKFKEIFNSGRVYLVSALKLLIFPVIALLLMWIISIIPAFSIDAKMVTSILICVAMPTATMTMTFAEVFNGDKYTAVKITLQTTLFSIVTIPLFVTVLSLLGFVAL
ncbi:MAG: AEC family transporter [Clostridia bacterium]|nr:AEC family transporter [Clostridia bacterium]